MDGNIAMAYDRENGKDVPDLPNCGNCKNWVYKDQDGPIGVGVCLLSNFEHLFDSDATCNQHEKVEPKTREVMCYKSGEPCKYDCQGLCKESC